MVDGLRRVALALRSAVGAEILTLVVDEEDGHVRSVRGEDPSVLPVGAPDRVGGGQITHYGRPEGALVVVLDVREGVDTVDVSVREVHLRPGELVGEVYFRRPPGLAPNIVARSDRAVLRSALRLALADGLVVRGDGAVVPAVMVPVAGATVPDTASPDTSATDTTRVAAPPPDTMPPGPPDTTARNAPARDSLPPDTTVAPTPRRHRTP